MAAIDPNGVRTRQATKVPPINTDHDMLFRMECDLIQKITEAVKPLAGEIPMTISGVFNIDDMERMQVSDLGGCVGIGVGYSGADQYPAGTQFNNNQTKGSNAVQAITFTFVVLLAIPVGRMECDSRYSATSILSVIRNAISGTTPEGDPAARPWVFRSEKPNISESSAEVLYYSQVWSTNSSIVNNHTVS